MEGIKQIALSVSVSAAVISAFYIICPDGNMSKQMKYIIGLLMLLAVLTPIVSVNIEIPTSDKEIEFSADATDMVASQYSYIAKSILENEKIYFEQISVITDILEDGNIIISKVCVYGAEDIEKAKSALSVHFEEVEFIE
ncbi:MAG: hypothetical protein UHE86_04185 [Acutalibacteraceae bacterium]|nr:hypothetical protein [Clostridia bacterium]MEE1278242.1 hypothetical protein [Acutalibacteraceae bacterium]